MVANRFEAIDIYIQCKWYSFQPTIQRILPIMIISKSNEVAIKGFGNIIFNRETLENVIIIDTTCRFCYTKFISNLVFKGSESRIFILCHDESLNKTKVEFQQ